MLGAGVEVVEVTDPACAWCWGSEPKLRRLRWRFGLRLEWRVVLTGLSSPHPPGEEAAAIAAQLAAWRTISGHTSIPAPTTLAQPLADTRRLCRVAAAAFARAPELGLEVLRRLRESIFVWGAIPESAAEMHGALRGVLPEADLWRLLARAASRDVEETLRADARAARQPGSEVLDLDEIGEGSGRAVVDADGLRFALPTLILRGPAGERTIPGWKPADVYEAALLAVAPQLERARRPDPTPGEALARFGSLTEPELETLCGDGARPPRDAVPVGTPGRPLWLDPREASYRGLARQAQTA